MGTIGGNLASGSPIADSVPFHLVLDTVLELASVRGHRLVRLEDFYKGYRQTVLEPDELIVSIQTRLPNVNERLRLFKISKRRDMDISTVTFAILVNIANDRIVDAKVAVGGVGPQVMRMAPAEAFLRGKEWSPDTLRAAGLMMRQQITPWTDVRGGADYRRQLVENLMVKSYYPAEPSVTVAESRGHDES
jgi:xanthine dehydrogenase small subunit